MDIVVWLKRDHAQANLVRVPATSKRRLDNLQDLRGKNDQPSPRC